MKDAYLFGHVSTGVIVRLKDRFPGPDGYAEISETLENHCGEATGSSITLARSSSSRNAGSTAPGSWSSRDIRE